MVLPMIYILNLNQSVVCMFESGAIRANTCNQYTTTNKGHGLRVHHQHGTLQENIGPGPRRKTKVFAVGALSAWRRGWAPPNWLAGTTQHIMLEAQNPILKIPCWFISSYCWMAGIHSRIQNFDGPLWVCIPLKTRSGAAFCLKSSQKLMRLNTITCSMSSLDYGEHENLLS